VAGGVATLAPPAQAAAAAAPAAPSRPLPPRPEDPPPPYAAFDLDPARVRAAQRAGFRVFYGDGTRPSILRAAGIDRPPRAFVVCYGGEGVGSSAVSVSGGTVGGSGSSLDAGVQLLVDEAAAAATERAVRAVRALGEAFPGVPAYAVAGDFYAAAALREAGAARISIAGSEAGVNLASAVCLDLGAMDADVLLLRRDIDEALVLRTDALGRQLAADKKARGKREALERGEAAAAAAAAAKEAAATATATAEAKQAKAAGPSAAAHASAGATGGGNGASGGNGTVAAAAAALEQQMQAQGPSSPMRPPRSIEMFVLDRAQALTRATTAAVADGLAGPASAWPKRGPGGGGGTGGAGGGGAGAGGDGGAPRSPLTRKRPVSESLSTGVPVASVDDFVPDMMIAPPSPPSSNESSGEEDSAR
jgi:voltage-gated potassium channel Kch